MAESLDVPLEAQEDVSILAEPVQVGNLTAPNSLAVHPMEGCDGDSQGRPSKLTVRRYERFASGGAGLLWAEAIAVVPEGRANPRQLWINEDSKASIAAMVTKMRQAAVEANGPDHRPIIVAQLTHSGRYSKPTGVQHPLIPQRDPYRDAKINLPEEWPILTDEYLDELQNAYVVGAKLAFEAGFDAVDVKSCHGYLINEILACHTREGKYGGSFENRTRFLLEVVDRIHEQLGEDKMVVARLGIYDAIPYPYGWGVDKEDHTKPDLTEPKKLLGLLAERNVPMINITIANPYYNPHYGRAFNQPITGGYESPEHPLTGVSRLISLAGEVQKAYPEIAFVGTGYSWLRTLLPNVAAATKAAGLATFIGAGRMAFAYPDFASDIVNKGKLDGSKVCIACSACTQIMRDGGRAGCVVRDNKVYGPIFKRGRHGDKENLLRLAEPCRQCQDSTCQQACPAGIDIPEFIRLFSEGDERGAYDVIRAANLFPEVCAWLCPVEQQCQGNCLEHFLGDASLPIADIQRYLAVQANRNGWSKLQVPERKTGKSVAVIGAGPAGLACAAMLLEAGHAVTIYDRAADTGGMIESVIPADRVSDSLKSEIDAIFKDVPADRLTWQNGVELTADFNLDKVMADGFDAAFVGLGLPRASGGTGQVLDGLWNSLDFLKAAKHDGQLDVAGKRVAVIGGGNTAMDAAVTAKQLGAKDVYLLYRRSFAEMPAWPAERDGALNEGVHFVILTQQLEYLTEGQKVTGIKVCPTTLGEPDSSGRRRPLPQEGSAYDLDTDIIVEAIGQQSPADLDKILPGVDIDKGLIQTKDGSFGTTRDSVWAGGDLVEGAATVVAAVADGMKAGKEMNEFLG